VIVETVKHLSKVCSISHLSCEKNKILKDKKL